MNRSIFLLIFFPIAILAQPQRYYVNDDAFGQDNGQNWSDAFNNLHDALALAKPGDEVWVASGTYKPSAATDRNARFQLPSGVALYGGFAGSEFFLDERDIQASPTILSGDIGVQGDSLDNSYTLLYLLNPDFGTIVDGFIFKAALANNTMVSNGAAGMSGAALYIMAFNGLAYPDIRNCIFERNTAQWHGGAVFVNGGGSGSAAPVFEGCRFLYNRSAGGSGGGLYKMGGSWVERPNDVADCHFEGNYAHRSGGAVYFADSPRSDSFQVRGCKFYANEARLEADAVCIGSRRMSRSYFSIFQSWFEAHYNSGCILTDQFSSSGNLDLSVDNCVFKNNLQLSNTQFRLSGGDFIFGDFNFKLTNCIIDSCNVYSIGSVSGSDLTGFNVIKNIFISNSIHFSNFYLENSSILSNISEKNSSFGIFLAVNSFSEFAYISNVLIHNCYNTASFLTGSAINPVKIANATIAQNTGGGNYSQGTPPELYNCISFGNKRPDGSALGSLINYSSWLNLYSCLFDRYPDSNWNFDAGCQFNTTPLFVNYLTGDFHLRPCSPGVDMGNNAIIGSLNLLTDITGAPRIQESTVDIGAYESPAFALAALPNILPACAGASGGAITISPENGCEPYTYNWQPAAGNGPEISSLPPGDYAYTVTDARGRKLTDTLSIFPAPSPQLAPVGQDLQCGSPLGGSATVAVTNGAAPYSFIWQDGAIDSLRAMLPAGQYQVTVTDRNGCTGAAQVTVGKQGNITLMVDGQPISCTGAADAAISAAPVNGKAPYQYLWSPAGSSDSLLTGLGPGAYTVTATDFYGCTATYTFTISDPPLLQAAVLAMHCSSLQSPNGIATAALSGGTPPHEYAWSNLGSTMTIGGLPPGIYTVTVTDAHGCTATASAEVKLVSGTVDLAGIQVQVWPNPMRERLALRAAGLPSGPWRFVLRDALGREVASADVAGDSAVLDVRDLSPGAYCWALEGAGGALARGKVLR